ncbi:MAG: hypothetical protein EPO13_02495 [Actinomycetota bacterium]|nr:MAG: hypothetical protein EPO13_02495 [Actinomycetota bacterium]
MGVGVGVFLLAVGLILALAVQDRINGVDLVLVGWIVAGAGVVAIILSLVMMAISRRERISVDRSDVVVEDRLSPPYS